MAKRMPARYKSGPKKGQFKPKSSRSTKSRARRNGTKKGQVRKTRAKGRRAYTKRAPAKRKARRNSPAMNSKALMQVIGWSTVTAFGQGYVRSYLSRATNSPAMASYGTTAVIGWLGYWLTKKAKTKPAGYAVLGVAFGQLAQEIGTASGIFSESGAGFVPRSQVMRNPPRRVNVGRINPVASIVVPS